MLKWMINRNKKYKTSKFNFKQSRIQRLMILIMITKKMICKNNT